MAVSNYYALQAFKATVDMTDGYGKGVVAASTAEHAVKYPAAAGPILGVVVEHAPAGGTVGVCTERNVKVPVRVSAAVAIGAGLAVGNDGRFATATENVVAVALEAATGENQIITALLGGAPGTAGSDTSSSTSTSTSTN